MLSLNLDKLTLRVWIILAWYYFETPKDIFFCNVANNHNPDTFYQKFAQIMLSHVQLVGYVSKRR